MVYLSLKSVEHGEGSQSATVRFPKEFVFEYDAVLLAALEQASSESNDRRLTELWMTARQWAAA